MADDGPGGLGGEHEAEHVRGVVEVGLDVVVEECVYGCGADGFWCSA